MWRWLAVRNNNNNAWIFNNNGNINNNNFNNAGRVSAVANLKKCLSVRIMVELQDLIYVYYRARKNKRRSTDTVKFEIDFEANLVNLQKKINSRELTADSNYAFVVFSPKAREIFATSMETRVVHHYLDWRLRPIYEAVLSPISYNNRKGMGQHAAVEAFRRLVKEESLNYTRDAWIIHLDFKGYFPNADVDVAFNQQKSLIERYYNGPDKEDLIYMMDVALHADPARHCDVFVPRENWDAIAPEKSLFNKPTGVGGAIGFLVWQNAMGLYINDVTRWLNEELGFKMVVFVDDIFVVTTRKTEFLNLMPEIRRRLAEINVKFNERKFYCQHYSKGAMVLGAMVKFDRCYLNRNTCKKGLATILKHHQGRITKRNANNILASLNCYIGMVKKRNNYKRMLEYKDLGLKFFGKFMLWNDKKACFNLKPEYSFKKLLKKRYNLTI